MSDHYTPCPLWTPGDSTNGTPPRLSLDEAGSERPQFRPIETPYAGYRFRSLLEAKQAVFLDGMKIEWHYELDSFRLLPFDEWYRPDIYIPGYGYIEVKPPRFDEQELRKPYLLNHCLAKSDDPVKSRERVYVLHGGIH